MKAIIVQGCKDCPYAYCDSPAWNIWHCTHGHFQILDKVGESLPENPHTDCKLNDLPTPEQIHEKTSKFRDNSDYYKGEIEGFEYGANWLIQQISK